MVDDQFEWDIERAAANFDKNGVSFQPVERTHDRKDYAKPSLTQLILNAATAYGSSRRGRQKSMSNKIITAKIVVDGKVVEVLKDGTERPFSDLPMRSRTEGEIAAAASDDPDSRPMTVEELSLHVACHAQKHYAAFLH